MPFANDDQSPAPDTRPAGLYERGATTVVALAEDPRFSYCLYIPEKGEPAKRAVACVIHGSYRDFIAHRDQFIKFGETQNCVVIAPLFPGNVLGDGNLDGFKYMVEGDIRYDRILEAIVAQVRARYGIRQSRFGLVGFSGGAHFAHRFLLLRPELLWGVSIGAPGSVTLLDEERDWWPGIRNVREMLGIAVDPQRIGQVPIQLVVGDADLDTSEINHRPGGRYWAEGANAAGATRPDRLLSLKESLATAGIPSTFDLLPDVGHEAGPVFAAAQTFLAMSLARYREL